MNKEISIKIAETGYIISLKCGAHEETHACGGKNALISIIRRLLEKDTPEKSITRHRLNKFE